MDKVSSWTDHSNKLIKIEIQVKLFPKSSFLTTDPQHLEGSISNVQLSRKAENLFLDSKHSLNVKLHYLQNTYHISDQKYHS